MGDGEIREHVRDLLVGEPALADLDLYETVEGEGIVVRHATDRPPGDVCVTANDGVVTLSGTGDGRLLPRLRRRRTRAFADAQLVRTPLLVLQGDADRVVVPAGAGELDARLTCPHELVMLPGYYHEILNEPPPERARALAVIDAWFARWLG